jgi:hypothetical protein
MSGEESGAQHVVPVDDLFEHETTTALCTCLPRVQVDGRLVIHNSYDGREIGEVSRKLIGLLTRALRQHKHAWTPEEFDALEHAKRALGVRYPRTF